MQKVVAELRSGDSLLEPQELELAQLIVTTLNLETRAAGIDPLAPLYKEGLGLDSIDILEIALAISKAYGIRLRSDDENNKKIFSSLRNLSRYIQQSRAKP
ncbi:MAG TPA: phosphopantetheine-binding protein [Burkholderiales bacterium]|nr:phosphopantetheine-binding protein [Burkholderiales bacterium]